MATAHRPRLNIVPGGREPVLFGAIEVYVAPPAHPPFSPTTQVLEEDTALVTSAPAVIRDRPEHPVRLMTDAVFQTVYPPGLVLTRGRRRWLAVVYDFEQEPICRAQWVQRAWHGIYQQTRHYGVASLSVPLLGITLSDLPLGELTDGFIDAMVDDPIPLQRLWLVTPEHQCVALRKILHARLS